MLPVYQVERSGDVYMVNCPRKTCGGEFWVPIAWARLRVRKGADDQEVVIVGRPCPHCSKTAEIPADIRVEPQLPTRKRRVVRRRSK